MKHILKCCGYTMKETCECGKKTATTKPARYSPQKFAKYRQKARKEDLRKRGLL
ncbi:RNA-protein complex protein Nop10 [Candidatus Woesearchaeota archaeon]|nr:RNA-protein complex protein Nop10 [Candidatus Woesearchaeota archaeon]